MSTEEQCLRENSDVKCEISEEEKSIFVPNISYSQQPTQQAYACLRVSKTVEKRPFIVGARDGVRSVGTECLQSQHSRWTYTWCNVELVEGDFMSQKQ